MKQIVLGLCDDQQEVLLELEHILTEILAEDGTEQYCIHSYQTGQELLDHISECHMVFLDIDMPEMDGIAVGKEIVRRQPQCRIIMASGIVERFKECFSIEAVRFVTKPFDKKEIKEAVEAVKRKMIGEPLIELNLHRQVYRIPQKKIEYIRAFNGYTEYRINGKWFRKDSTLEEVENQLDQRLFTRISRQFIVNLGYIQTYRKNTVYMPDLQLPVSRRNKKAFEKKYIEYDLQYR